MSQGGKSRPDITGMTSLKVANLPCNIKHDDLKRLFEKFGEIGDVHIPHDKHTRESRGFAYVRFYDYRDAQDAMEAMDEHTFENRELRVQLDRYGRPEIRSSRSQPEPMES